MSVPITPVADYVVAEQEEAATKTASGLYLPGSAQEKPKFAKVLAIGNNVKEVKVGDRIIYAEGYDNSEVKTLEGSYLLIKESNIRATVKGS